MVIDKVYPFFDEKIQKLKPLITAAEKLRGCVDRCEKIDEARMELAHVFCGSAVVAPSGNPIIDAALRETLYYDTKRAIESEMYEADKQLDESLAALITIVKTDISEPS